MIVLKYTEKMARIFLCLWVFLLLNLKYKWTCLAATNFCLQPLGMERRIIGDAQITASSTYNAITNSGKEARLYNNKCWCSATSTQTNQWVKVDLEKPLQITGFAIQGDPFYTTNFIRKFMLKYSTDGSLYHFTKDTTSDNLYTGANAQNQLITRMFETKPFPTRYVEFRPTERNPGGNNVCVRFELYGCSYVCSGGLGIEVGLSLPSGFILSASSSRSGNEALKGRLSDPSCWCANTNAANEYLQIDFGKIVTITGIAIQGNPTTGSWVKDFYMDYGTTASPLTTYTEKGVQKLFIGSKDKNTIVVNWLKVRLRAKIVKVKPNTFVGYKCMRIEVIGCDSDFVAEVGAENRVLEDSRFQAYAVSQWVPGRYFPKDGRLNNDRPWGSEISGYVWFKVDLGRVMLVNAIAIQGDPTWGPNFFPDYKVEFGLESTGATVVTMKSEGSNVAKIFPGNTNNMGVKFSFLKDSPISTRYVQFLKNTQPQNANTLRVEIYASPQVCSTSFGMAAGESSAFEPTITVSSGTVPSSKAKINSEAAWCGGGSGSGQYFMYDLGKNKQISGIAIQGNPTANKWVKTFKVQYGLDSSSLTTYSVGGTEKEFVGCKSRDLIVYNWFPTEITTRYLKIIPVTSETEACLRLNIYGCPFSGCFERIGIESSTKIANSLLTSSTFNSDNEAYKSRFNSYTTWAACQTGSCSPKEASSKKPWIQVCLASYHTISAVIIQGHGDQDNLTDIKTFTVQYKYSPSYSWRIYYYKYLTGNNPMIFAVSTGRYGSKQINFPVPVVTKCLRIKVESQTQSNKNVGLRWELLGCNSVKKVTLYLTKPSLTITRGSRSSVLCWTPGQEGGIMEFKKSGKTMVNSDIYYTGIQHRSDWGIQGNVYREMDITAKGPSIASSDALCSVTDAIQGIAQCKQTIQCSLVYPDIPALGNKSSFTVTFTGLIGKPQAPTAVTSSNITQTSTKIMWNASVAGDFQVENYKVSIKKKSDGSTARPDQTATTQEATFNSLTVFTNYTVEVSAKSITVNVYSAVGTHHFRTDEGAAAAPRDVTATSVSATMITLKWKQPTSMNGILHEYQIKYRKSTDSAFSAPVSAAQNLFKLIDKLQAVTEYDFQVAAATKLGTITGAWSKVIKAKTKEVLSLIVSKNLTVNEGETATFICNSSSNDPVTWLDPLNNTLSSSNGILTFNSVTRQLTGSYHCRANISGLILNKMVTLTIYYKPYSVQFTTSNATPLNGTDVILNCSSTGRPKPRYTISYQTSSGAFVLYDGPSGVYKVKAINYKSFGNVRVILSCFSYNTLGTGPSSNKEIAIQVPPIVRITPNIQMLVVKEGDYVQLKCEVLEGNPQPLVTWTDSEGGSLTASGNALTFGNVKRHNANTYICTVKNYLATVVNNITLIVQYRPTVELLLPETKKCESQSLTIACLTDGVPTVNVKLFFEKSLLVQGKGFLLHKISKITSSQFGKYSCSASNLLGSQNATKILQKQYSNCDNQQAASIKKGDESSTFSTTTYTFAAISFVLLIIVIVFACKFRRGTPKKDTNVIKNENTLDVPVPSYMELDKVGQERRNTQPYAILSPERQNEPNKNNDYYLYPNNESSTDNKGIYDSIQ